MLCGENDPIVPAQHLVQLSSDIDAVKFQSLRSCGHAPHLERTEAFVSSIVEFLSELGFLPELAASVSESEDPSKNKFNGTKEATTATVKSTTATTATTMEAEETIVKQNDTN